MFRFFLTKPSSGQCYPEGGTISLYIHYGMCILYNQRNATYPFGAGIFF